MLCKTIPVMACSHSLMKEETDEGRKHISVVSVVFLPLHDFACLIFYLSSSILTGPVLHLVPSLLRSRSINVLLVHLLFQPSSLRQSHTEALLFLISPLSLEQNLFLDYSCFPKYVVLLTQLHFTENLAHQ